MFDFGENHIVALYKNIIFLVSIDNVQKHGGLLAMFSKQVFERVLSALVLFGVGQNAMSNHVLIIFKKIVKLKSS